MLVLVVAVLMVSYASSLRAYLDQRQHIGSLKASIASSEANIAALEREKQRWHDPAYIVAQARARFTFGFPGEIGYQVLDEDGHPLDPQVTLSAPKRLDQPAPQWWQTTLSSIDAAAFPAQHREPQPAEKVTVPAEESSR